jgi:CheY-like chemotaxis protein
MKILVAEDNEMTAEILRLHLRKHGFEAIIASNGVEALACLEATPDISLVITDIMMPVMDGFALVAEMRSRLEMSDIPVVVASARAEPDAVTKAAELGCRQFLVKPVHDANLVKAIRIALKEHQNLLRPQHEILHQLGIDSETYRKLAGRFAALAGAVVEKLEECLAEEGKTRPEQADLGRLLEAAKLLGADRLAQVVDQLAREEELSDGSTDGAQRRLLIRELRMLISTMESRSLSGQARRVPEAEQPEDGDGKEDTNGKEARDSEREPQQGGRTLEVKRRVVRVS